MYNHNSLHATQMRAGTGSTVMALVLGLLGVSCVFTANGALIGINAGPGGYLMGLIASLVYLVALMLLKEQSPLPRGSIDGPIRCRDVLGGIVHDHERDAS